MANLGAPIPNYRGIGSAHILPTSTAVNTWQTTAIAVLVGRIANVNAGQDRRDMAVYDRSPTVCKTDALTS